MADIRNRIAEVVGAQSAEQIIHILEEEGAQRCRDTNCIRLRPHSRLSVHRWRHVAVAPLSPGVLGRRCLTCGQPSWRRIHRTGRTIR
ncbi:hypothetical protein [Streptomyces alfalfae]